MSEAADAAATRAVALTTDGALVLTGDVDTLALVEPWIPRGRGDADLGASARLHVDTEPAGEREAAVGEPTFTIGGVAAWIAEDVASIDGAGVVGRVDLRARRAELHLPATGSPRDDVSRRSALTAAAALLLGRMGRALVHAGAVVHPANGEAWLLVGDTHAGKSTTVANLVRAGWTALADDTIALSSVGDAVLVEGWPRTMHLDAGWGTGLPAGHRIARLPEDALGGAPRQTPARLGGLLFPAVHADRPTSAQAARGADALGRLIRQSPWLFADARVAPAVLALLRRAAARPAAALSLGTDSFGDAARLDAVVRAVTG